MAARETRYRLNVRLMIVREERDDPEHEYWRNTNETLSVEESLDLGSRDFLSLTHVLAALHDAIKGLGAARTDP
jgi:hypothetical protein